MAGIGPTPSGVYLDIPVFNSLFPSEGGKIIPVVLDFSLQQSYTIDLTLLQQRQYIKFIQAVFVDNRLNTTPVLITANGAGGQPLQVPGSSQAYLPIFATNPPIFQVNCTGGNVVKLYFVNMPLPAAVWNSTAQFAFNGSGYLEVTDVALDGAITGNSVNITEQAQQNGNILKPVFAADELFTGSTTTSAAQTIMTGSTSFFIKEMEIGLSGAAALAAAGEYTVTVSDGATVIATGIAYLPITSGTTPGKLPLIALRNLNYNSKGNGQALTVKGSANLAAGHLFWNIAGGLCSNIGP